MLNNNRILDIPYDKFQEYGKVYIDNELVDSKNYKVSEGSTIITFNKDYVNKLDKDTHNIKVEMNDGEVTTTFKLYKNEKELIKETKKEEKLPLVEKINQIIENPNTNDKIVICLILLFISIFGILTFKKKRI